MKYLILLYIFIIGVYGFEADTSGIPIIIVNNRFDNAWSDTTRSTVIHYKKTGNQWYILKDKNTDYFLPYPQFLIFKEE